MLNVCFYPQAKHLKEAKAKIISNLIKLATFHSRAFHFMSYSDVFVVNENDVRKVGQVDTF